MFNIIQAGNKIKWIRVWTSSKSPTQKKSCRTSTANVEITHHWSPKRSSRHLPPWPMGRITYTNWYASQSIQVLKYIPKGLLMDRPQRRPQPQYAPIGAPWRIDPNVRKPQQKKNPGREKQAWLLCWHILRTLPLLLGVDEWEHTNTSQILPSQQAMPLWIQPSNSPVHCVEVFPLH